ncbi:hypothetical protein LAZ67_2004517 [Cordylochernes scorpioides]|uniref:t-SNARE coiled-coil homology domain-containing protein n=1 Tax=Cordylochernes scorpioides TaxID=51811 RepID=A0ABY6K763_9ARAC|nr:hypothetical protein LAZ67_2004517 [Cordylochernes scorpioides]
MLTIQQKENHVEVAKKMLEMVEENPNWKEKVITGDETWVYGYDPETKRQSMEWKGKYETRTKKSRLCKSKNKVLLVTFFDIKGIVHYEYLTELQHRVARISFRLFLGITRPKVKCGVKNWIIHHDNAPPHTATSVLTYLAKHGIQIQQPPYSPDLAPNDFFLFPKLKMALKGRRFDTRVHHSGFEKEIEQEKKKLEKEESTNSAVYRIYQMQSSQSDTSLRPDTWGIQVGEKRALVQMLTVSQHTGDIFGQPRSVVRHHHLMTVPAASGWTPSFSTVNSQLSPGPGATNGTLRFLSLSHTNPTQNLQDPAEKSAKESKEVVELNTWIYSHFDKLTVFCVPAGRLTTDDEVEEMLESGNAEVFSQGIDIFPFHLIWWTVRAIKECIKLLIIKQLEEQETHGICVIYAQKDKKHHKAAACFESKLSLQLIVITQNARQTLADIEARHEDITKLEKSIRELHEMFVDLALLVENQGELINNIARNVSTTVDYTVKGKEDIVKARTLQSKYLKTV